MTNEIYKSEITGERYTVRYKNADGICLLSEIDGGEIFERYYAITCNYEKIEPQVLTHNQQIKVETFKYRPVITVGTQRGFFDSDAEYNRKYGNVYEESTGEDYAWTCKDAACLTADYRGKAEEMRKKQQAYDNAATVVNGEIVIIDGRRFTVRIAGEHYSDPIHFKEIK